MKRILNICLVSTLVLIGMMALTGCDRASTSSDAKTQWIDPKTLEPGPIAHESLTEDQMSRIQRLRKVFSEVDSSPLEKWVDDFKRDVDLESELRIWENMATAYETFTASKNLTLSAKKEVYKVVLLRSGAPEEEVLKHSELKILSEKDEREIMALFTNKPEPIQVVSPR